MSEPTNSTYFVSQRDILNFVRLSNQIVTIFTDTDGIVENLLELLEKASSGDQTKRTRRRRQVSSTTNTVNSNTILTRIDLIESLINSTNGTTSKKNKMAMLHKVHTFMQQLCTQDTFSAKSFGKSERPYLN